MSEHEQDAEAERQRQEQEAERQRQEDEAAAQREQAQPEQAAAPPPVEESPEDAAARRLATRGAQVVLDPHSDAAIAAKGGMAPTIDGNVEARDEALLAMGLVPSAPSGDIHDMTEQEKLAHAAALEGGAEVTPHLEAQRATVERTEAQTEAMHRAAAEGRERPSGAF